MKLLTSGFVLKTKYDTDKLELEKKIPNTSNLVKKSAYNAKVSEIGGEIRSISGLATTSALTAVENKIPSNSNLLNKTNYNTKITEIENKFTDHKHDEYITTSEFNRSKANLVTKTDSDVSNKTKHLLIENELKKLKTFDLTYFIGKRSFDEEGAQNYLIFHSILKHFTLNSKWITKWKSKGISNENLEVVSTSNNSLTPSINYYGDKARLRFTGSVLQQKTVT